MRAERLFWVAAAAALALVLVFIALPLVAIFTDVAPGRVISELGDSSSREALRLSIETSAIALALILGLGTPAAYLLARRRFRGRSLLLTLIELPLVLPPAAAGIALLASLGPHGVIGGPLRDAGFTPLSTAGVVIALAFVSSPFYLRAAEAAFDGLDPSLLDAARTLGAGPARVFARVAVPTARQGLAAGAGLAFARARRIRRDAAVRRQLPRCDADGAARDLRPFRDRFPRRDRAVGRARLRERRAPACNQARAR